VSYLLAPFNPCWVLNVITVNSTRLRPSPAVEVGDDGEEPQAAKSSRSAAVTWGNTTRQAGNRDLRHAPPCEGHARGEVRPYVIGVTVTLRYQTLP
jgi:hypothetical protein